MRALILAALLVSGCAMREQYIWYRADTTQQQFMADELDCHQISATSSTTSCGALGCTTSPVHDEEVYTWCMQSRGYTATEKRRIP